jgi:hypothetical protein
MLLRPFAAAAPRFDLRSEASVLGGHKLPVGGMAHAPLPHDIGEWLGCVYRPVYVRTEWLGQMCATADAALMCVCVGVCIEHLPFHV